MANVTKIPAYRKPYTSVATDTKAKRKVAGYARVSTDTDEQFTSFSAQTDYYTNYIKANPDWEFVGVYTDEGISGTNTKQRDGFNRMIADALAGKIDLIVTKSVSRFARNTVDSLTTVRKLKDHGTEVYFEKENIYTFDGKGELLITIMSSLAQEESRSISENVTWGQRKRFSDGKVSMPYERFLGYRKGPDGKPEIVPDEARTVRVIYRLFMEGYTPGMICKRLENMCLLSPGGKDTWSPSTIISILSNEKYKGDALLQKRFTVDFLQKKTKKNEGEVPQYYVTDSHPAIIEADEWDLVQAEIARRKAMGRKYSGKSVFSAKLICEDCGSFYGSKLWHSTDKYRKTIWQCNEKFKNEKHCETPTLSDDEIKERFVRAYYIMMENKQKVISDAKEIIQKLMDFNVLDAEITRLEAYLQITADMMSAEVNRNASEIQNQEDYARRVASLEERYNTTSEVLAAKQAERDHREEQAKIIRLQIRYLEKQEKPLDCWSASVWTAVVENATVHREQSITFKFYNGTEITVEA